MALAYAADFKGLRIITRHNGVVKPEKSGKYKLWRETVYAIQLRLKASK